MKEFNDMQNHQDITVEKQAQRRQLNSLMWTSDKLEATR